MSQAGTHGSRAGVVVGISIAVFGAVILLVAYALNQVPVPDGTGPNIGAGILWLGGITISSAGVVVTLVAVVVRALLNRGRRRQHVNPG